MDFDQKEATGNPSKALEASSPHLAPSPPGTKGHPPLPIHSHQPTAPPGQLSSNSTASVNTSIFFLCVCVCWVLFGFGSPPLPSLQFRANFPLLTLPMPPSLGSRLAGKSYTHPPRREMSALAAVPTKANCQAQPASQ